MSRALSSRRRLVGWAVLALPLVLAACSSGSGGSGSSSASASADSSLKQAGARVLSNMTKYTSTVSACTSASVPVACVEAADRALGNQVHDYANMLAVGKGFTAPQGDLVSARNSAQTLANSLEILGDAQPTQANYNQVLNTFNLNAAIAQLHGEVQTLNQKLGG